MNAHLSGPFSAAPILVGAALFTFLLAFLPVCSLANQPVVTTAISSVVEDVPLSDLDLSTAEGMHLARDRLHVMAERLCAEGRESLSQRSVPACVASTVTNALRQISWLRQSDRTARNSVLLAKRVSLADLDLSTLEGASTARQRLETIAHRLCHELATRPDLSYAPDYATCVHDSLTGAWAQANVIRAAGAGRTAQRAVP